MSKRAIILAGGEGTRLRPYTNDLPKPLVAIADMPIIEIIVRQLANLGFDEITITINYKGEQIKNFFEERSDLSVNIDYVEEKEPLGTMGSVLLAKSLPENFLVLNGDILTNLNFDDFFHNHFKNKNLLTVSTFRRKVKSDYGEIISSRNIVQSFSEKPTRETEVSMGVYALNKSILKYFPKGNFGFDDLMKLMIKRKINVSTNLFDGEWLDIGREIDYFSAIDLFKKNRKVFLS